MHAHRYRLPLFIVVSAIVFSFSAFGDDQPQWGAPFTRNMISKEKGLPTNFNLESGENILWTAPLGGGAYGSPIISQGCVFIGSNNSEPRDLRHQGDRGAMYCLDEKDGSLRWQFLTPRIGGDDYLDWPWIGLCSSPTVEGNRVYTVTNRAEVICLDLNGFADGNDGPFMDEGRLMTPLDSPAQEPMPPDADVIWLFDMRKEVGMYPHDSPFTAILLDGDCLYVNTGNGVDNTHIKVRCPDAPSLIVLDKNTGRLLAKDGEHIGPQVFHATWAPSSLANINGQKLVFFGGPNGVCYAFKALVPPLPDTVQTLERVWRFDCDPTAPKENVHAYSKNTKEGPSVIVAMPVVYNNCIYTVAGGDIWWGKRQSWLKCISATQTGDVTDTAELWSYEIPRQSSATPAILNGLVFVTDDAGHVHCVDAETGEPAWKHRVGSSIWGSALGAEGRIYVAARCGTFAIIEASKELNVLFTTRFPEEITGTPTAANGVLYVATLNRLYAIKTGAGTAK